MSHNRIELLISDIEKQENREFLRAWNLDSPAITAQHDGKLVIAGWAVPKDPYIVASIEIVNGEYLLKRTPVCVPRPDVEQHFNILETSSQKFGFHVEVGTLGLPKNCTLTIKLNLYNPKDQSRTKIEISKIKGKNRNHTRINTKYQPTMLTAIGRSGTTLLMSMLSEHKGILTSNFYPYEVKQTSYWIHLLKVLTDPADFINSSHPDSFERNFDFIGHNPYSHQESVRQHLNPGALESLYRKKYSEEFIKFCTARIDDFYELIEKTDKKYGAKLFAEKFLPSHIQSIIEDIYTAPKEIILTRDFRDMICSARAFNEKRNSQGFGRDRATDEQDWVRRVFASGARSLALAWSDRKNTALHIRYEDLVTSPETQLKRIFEHINVESNPKIISDISGRIMHSKNKSLHQTSQSTDESISRWKKDLPDELLEYCNESMKHELSLFGYSS